MKKILVYTRYDRTGASSRLRCYAYADAFVRAGFEAEYLPLFDRRYLGSFYRNFRKPPVRTLVSLFRRWRELPKRAGAADCALIEYELLPFLPAERELKYLSGMPFILNFDDNVSEKYRKIGFLRDKYEKLAAAAAGVIAGNDFLLDKFSAVNPKVIKIPTVVDLDKYLSCKVGKYEVFTLCWIGNPATYAYLEGAAEHLREIGKRIDYELLVVATRNLARRAIPGVKMRFVDWSDGNEVKYLKRSHIGIMPLPANDGFARGKSAYKLIQYMAAELPSIASPVGENTGLLEKSGAGVLASTPKEWADAAEKLFFNENFYRLCVDSAKTSAPEYSLERYGEIMTGFIRDAAGL